MVSYPILGNIVGADFFRPFARADLLPASASALCMAALLFQRKDSRAENGKGAFTILLLRSLILTGDYDAGGDVG